MSIGAAGSGPLISTASLSRRDPTGSFKPITAPIPPLMAAASFGLRASPGAAPPGATSGERPGSCREQASRARPADAVPEPAAPATAITPPIAGPRRAVPGSRPGWPGCLATRASSPGYVNNKAEHTAETRAVRQLPEGHRTEIRAAASSLHTTLRGVGGGPDAVRRQVI